MYGLVAVDVGNRSCGKTDAPVASTLAKHDGAEAATVGTKMFRALLGGIALCLMPTAGYVIGIHGDIEIEFTVAMHYVQDIAFADAQGVYDVGCYVDASRTEE